MGIQSSLILADMQISPWIPVKLLLTERHLGQAFEVIVKMADTLNQIQQTLLLALVRRGPLPRFHANTLRVLVDRGLVTSRRMVTPAGRKYATSLLKAQKATAELSPLVADTRVDVLAD